MGCKAQTTAIAVAIARICNVADRPKQWCAVREGLVRRCPKRRQQSQPPERRPGCHGCRQKVPPSPRPPGAGVLGVRSLLPSRCHALRQRFRPHPAPGGAVWRGLGPMGPERRRGRRSAPPSHSPERRHVPNVVTDRRLGRSSALQVHAIRALTAPVSRWPASKYPGKSRGK